MPVDQFFTPPDVADMMAECLGPRPIRCVADGACGDGSLLLAATRRFRKIKCVGVDVDLRVLRRLRRTYPQWQLFRADMLSARPRARVFAQNAESRIDALLLNPPFSARGAQRTLLDSSLECSVAMAHLILNLEVFRPRFGAIAIVPESLLYSEIDARARRSIARDFSVSLLASLSSQTFEGASVSSHIVQVVRRSRECVPNCWPDEPVESAALLGERIEIPVRVVRGGLPIHESQRTSKGALFLHSTDLRSARRSWGSLPRVATIGRGVICGLVILLPRVGVVSARHIVVRRLFEPVQLSDCVIALVFQNGTHARAAAELLRANFDGLQSLYVGTCAKYITVLRLSRFLESVGFGVG